MLTCIILRITPGLDTSSCFHLHIQSSQKASKVMWHLPHQVISSLSYLVFAKGAAKGAPAATQNPYSVFSKTILFICQIKMRAHCLSSAPAKAADPSRPARAPAPRLTEPDWPRYASRNCAATWCTCAAHAFASLLHIIHTHMQHAKTSPSWAMHWHGCPRTRPGPAPRHSHGPIDRST